MKKLTTLFSAFLAVFLISRPAAATAQPDAQKITSLITSSRELWADNAIWNHNVIASSVGDGFDMEANMARLLQNQESIGDYLNDFYGQKSGNDLSKLLREQTMISTKVLDAIKNGDKEEAKRQQKIWYENSIAIAGFLAALNPNWDEKSLQDFFRKHLDLITDTMYARVSKNPKWDIQAFDEDMDHVMALSDYLATGLIKQFPGKFY